MVKDCNWRIFLLSLLIATDLRPGGLAMAQHRTVDETADVTGTVTLSLTDGVAIPASGVRLALACQPETRSRVEVSDVAGAFRFGHVPADGCTIETDLQGFRSEKVAVKARHASVLQIRLEVEPIFAGLTVIAPDVPLECPVTIGLEQGARGTASIERSDAR